MSEAMHLTMDLEGYIPDSGLSHGVRCPGVYRCEGSSGGVRCPITYKCESGSGVARHSVMYRCGNIMNNVNHNMSIHNTVLQPTISSIRIPTPGTLLSGVRQLSYPSSSLTLPSLQTQYANLTLNISSFVSIFYISISIVGY